MNANTHNAALSSYWDFFLYQSEIRNKQILSLPPNESLKCLLDFQHSSEGCRTPHTRGKVTHVLVKYK